MVCVVRARNSQSGARDLACGHAHGLAPNLIAVFIVVRKWVLAAKHAHVRHLRTRESSTSAPATTAA